MPTDKQKEEEDVVLEPTEEEVGEENILQKLKNLREKLAVCSKEKAEYLAGWQRAKADYINLQKENSNGQKDIIRFAKESVIHDIIPVLDSFNVAVSNKESWNAVPENWRMGVEYIFSQLKTALLGQGVSEICPKEKDVIEFDSHAVVGTITTENPELDGKISEVLQKGYKIGDKIIRPARVNVYLYNK